MSMLLSLLQPENSLKLDHYIRYPHHGGQVLSLIRQGKGRSGVAVGQTERGGCGAERSGSSESYRDRRMRVGQIEDEGTGWFLY